MFNFKLYQKILTILGVIGLGLLITPSLILRGQAQSNDSQSSNTVAQQVKNQLVEEGTGFVPPERGAPKRTAEAGSRVGCGVEIKALVDGEEWAQTISEHPTFFWYFNPSAPVEKESDRAKGLQFVINDIETGDVYKKFLPLPSQAGIMSLTLLPEDGFAALEKGKFYEWFVNAYKTDGAKNDEPCYFVSGGSNSQILTPQQQQELDSLTTAEDRWNFYNQNNLWYDALATLHQLRRENPDDPTLNQLWSETLESIQLGELADQPLLEPTQIAGDLEEITER